MRLKQSNDQARDYVLQVDEKHKFNSERHRHHKLSSNNDLEQKIQDNRQMITSTRFLVAIHADYRIVLRALIFFLSFKIILYAS